jgi:integrase
MSNKTKKDRDGLHRRPNPDGIYYFFFRAADGRWRERSTGTRNYSEARLVRSAELEKIRKGELPSELRDCTLGGVAKMWLQQQQPLVLPITLAGYRWILQPLLDRFGGKKLKDISAASVRAYQAERASQCSHRTVNREIQTLGAIIRLAGMGQTLLEVKSLPDRPSGIGRSLSEEEANRFWITAGSRPEWQMISWVALLAANTGLRGGEIKRLRFRDLLLEKRIILVRRENTKTDAGERVIPLNTAALWGTERLLEREMCLGASLPEHFLLPANSGKQTKQGARLSIGYDPSTQQRSWRTAWRTLTRAAGLRGFRFHDLRHHFITKLAEAHVPIQVAMSLAGHMTPAMNRHYTHISDRAVRGAVDAISCELRFPSFQQFGTQPPGQS